MDRGLILLVAALMIYVAPGVHGTSHLSFNSSLTVDITRSGCGVTKLCVEMPNDCDPMNMSSSCLFASLDTSSPMAPNGVDLSVELRGVSDGFIALGLTAPQTPMSTMVFICAQNSTDRRFFFRTMERNNSNMALTPTETMVRDIRSLVNESVIKCEFTIPNLNATSTRSSHVTTFGVLVGTGTVNNDGSIGALNFTLNAGELNLAVANATPAPPAPAPTAPVTTAAPGNTTMPMTTAGSGAFQPHALLVLLSVLAASVTLRT